MANSSPATASATAPLGTLTLGIAADDFQGDALRPGSVGGATLAPRRWHRRARCRRGRAGRRRAGGAAYPPQRSSQRVCARRSLSVRRPRRLGRGERGDVVLGDQGTPGCAARSARSARAAPLPVSGGARSCRARAAPRTRTRGRCGRPALRCAADRRRGRRRSAQRGQARESASEAITATPRVGRVGIDDQTDARDARERRTMASPSCRGFAVVGGEHERRAAVAAGARAPRESPRRRSASRARPAASQPSAGAPLSSASASARSEDERVAA